MNNIENISQLKLELQKIITNINHLEDLVETEGQSAEYNLSTLRETEVLLQKLEAAPLEQFSGVLQKRKKKRLDIKKKAKQCKKAAASARTKTKDKTIINVATTSTTTLPEQPILIATARNSHHQLRSYYDAQRVLRTFELLKILHLERSQDPKATREFNAQFNHLCYIWNSILQKNGPKRTQEHKIEDQWNEVLFGASEKTFYGSEQKTNDFLRIRRTWDSYLTRDKRGTTIPIGWVLPKADVKQEWLQYFCE